VWSNRPGSRDWGSEMRARRMRPVTVDLVDGGRGNRLR